MVVMDKAQLSEIRASLREAAEREARPRRTLVPAFAARPVSAPPTAEPSVPARRVGLTPRWFEDEAIRGLAGPAETGRSAFGQRTGIRPAPAPLLLPAPEPEPGPGPGPDLAPAATRWTTLLAQRPAAAPAETPYHPEDVSDTVAGEADRLYDAAGLNEPPRLAAVREEAVAPPRLHPEVELLAHLERVFVAERAGIEARRL
jgi:hypothetical protein